MPKKTDETENSLTLTKLNIVDEIRQLDKIKEILSELQNRSDILKVDKSVFSELEAYLALKQSLPQILTARDRDTVVKANEALHEFQGKLDRVAAVHLGVRKILRALSRLEIMAKHAMARSGYITEKTSKPSSDLLLTLVLPELVTTQNDWECLGKICQDVQDHLGNAKDSLRLQMKMDENLHWAQREGA